MDPRKGHPDFIPGPGALPQKTPVPAGFGAPEGPVFDFADPKVAACEAALREAAVELEAAAQVPLEGLDDGEAYRAARAAADALVPELYARYDAYVAAVLGTGERVACRRGCGSCCSHYVTSVEPFEIIFMHGRIRTRPEYPGRLVALHRRAALFRSLLEREPAGEEAEDRALYRYYLRNQPCPFLGPTGACGVYESRPISCRMFFSLSDPSYCRGKAVTSPGNRNFIVELPEDIERSLARAGRAYARFELPESLFEGLLKANEAFGKYDAEEPGIRP